jgi:hypothetical protein
MSQPYAPGYGDQPLGPSPKIKFGWIGEAWTIYTQAWMAWLVLYLIPLPLSVGSFLYALPHLEAMIKAIQDSSNGRPPAMPVPDITYALTSNGLGVVSFAVSVLLAACASDIALRQVRGEQIAIGSIGRGLRNALQMFLYWILYYIAVLIGEIGCCIGITVTTGFLIPGFAQIADGVPAADAVTSSITAIKGDWFNAALFQLLLGLIFLVGCIVTCYLGSLVLGPMVFIISALAYRDLIGLPGGTSIPEDNGSSTSPRTGI